MAISDDGSAKFLSLAFEGTYVIMLDDQKNVIDDVNMDGIVDQTDAEDILKYVVGLDFTGDINVMDRNCDGVINAMDAAVILKRVAGII